MVRYVWAFLRVRKRFWLLPIIAFLIVLVALIVLTEVTSPGAFLYALF